MRYRRLDENGDMLPARGNPPFTGAEAVGAAIRSRLLSFYGDWWESPEDGIELRYLLGYQNEETERVTAAMVRQRILDTEGVSDVLDLTMGKIENHRRVITVEAVTDAGETVSVTV